MTVLTRRGRWRGPMALVVAAISLIAAMVLSPPEKVMGQRITILYVHVGAAWTAYLAYAVTAVGATVYLRRRQRWWDHLAVAAGEMGLVLTTLTLVTGSLWARSTQGWWWIWEPRLTITLFMWFLYAGYLILRQYTEGERQAVLSALVALAGVPAMVLNHFAVVLYRTFHPLPIIVRPSGPAVGDPRYLWGLALAAVAFTLVFAAFIADRVLVEARRDELLARRRER